MNDLSGNLIRGYQIGERISADGFSILYRAYQTAIERDVALRVILPGLSNQPDFIRRFEVEAQLIARLEHPHILPLYDYWRDPDGAFLVMRWLPDTLRNVIQRGVWSAESAARLLEQISEALTLAHREGIIHKRLTLDSILLDEDENAYLTDFGIARSTDAVSNKKQLGTISELDYASPEQINGGHSTPRTDIYGMGLIMYELLTGERPWPQNASTDEIAAWHLNQPLPALTLQRPALPTAINEVLQTATAKEPLHRYANALRFSAAFRAALPVIQRAPQQPLADPLTDRELDILRLMLADRSNPQIAQTLYLTTGTVKWYIQQLYRKLDVHSRRHAIDRARQLKLVEAREPSLSPHTRPRLKLVP